MSNLKRGDLVILRKGYYAYPKLFERIGKVISFTTGKISALVDFFPWDEGHDGNGYCNPPEDYHTIESGHHRSCYWIGVDYLTAIGHVEEKEKYPDICQWE